MCGMKSFRFCLEFYFFYEIHQRANASIRYGFVCCACCMLESNEVILSVHHCVLQYTPAIIRVETMLRLQIETLTN